MTKTIKSSRPRFTLTGRTPSQPEFQVIRKTPDNDEVLGKIKKLFDQARRNRLRALAKVDLSAIEARIIQNT